MRDIKFFIFLFILVLTSCAKDIVDLTCSIEGVVKDKDSGVSLSNCEVLLSPGNKTIVTSNDGLYSFKGLEPGEYTLSFNKNKYFTDSRNIITTAGEITKVEMMLKAKVGPIIEGVVKDKDSGVSLSNCEVLLSPGNKTIVTSNDGLYSFKGLEPGEYTLSFNKSGYNPDTRKVTANYGDTIKVEMLLKAKKGSIIEGIVKDKDSGVSLSNCEVLLSPGNETIVTSNDGLYSFKGLEPGEYTLSFNKSGYNPDSRKVTANYGDTIKVEMLLKAKSSFSLSENEYDYGDLESTKTFTCFNHSASDCVYTLSNLPEWINTDKNRGVVKAGSNDSFTLIVDRSKVNTGKYNQNITIEYSGQISGTEVLLIKMSKVEYTTPTVTTATLASSVNENSFSIEGTITATGGSQITSYGHCWSTSENPTINDQCTNLGMTDKIGSFKSTIEDLLVNTTYYVRAYATNSQGTAYGEQTIVKTKATESDEPWDGEIATSFAGGSGTNVDPYIIKTGGQLLLMKEYSSKCFELANDIDLNNNNWLPYEFQGSLNGNGNTIYNLKISRKNNNQGLFSELSGTIENVNINGVYIDAPQNSNIGVVAGEATNAVINNCNIIINNVIFGNENVGGVVGKFNGPAINLTNCNVSSQGVGIIKGNYYVGSIVGYLSKSDKYESKTENNHANINIEGGGYIGGCYGCINTDNPYHHVEISKHSFSGKIKGNSIIGGILGITYGGTSIIACKTSVNIEVLDNTQDFGVGGILGSSIDNYGGCTIMCCYSKGNIKFSGSYGGLVDYNTFSNHRNDIDIYHCFTTINDGIDYSKGGVIYNSLEETTSVYETSDVSQTMFEFYSKYAEYWNYKNTWIWNGEVNGEQVSIPCPKLAWEE